MLTSKRTIALILTGALLIGACAGCGSQPAASDIGSVVDLSQTEMELDLTPLAAAPAVDSAIDPVASGTKTESNSSAVTDYSNAADGYVMIKWVAGGSTKIKVQITGPSSTTYTYNLNTSGTYETFPLSDGSGSYQIRVMRNTSGTKYAVAQTLNTSVSLKDEFAPFLHPNQYVNFTSSSQTAKLAKQLASGKSTEIDKVSVIYEYVVKNISYDKQLAAAPPSGYLPNLDSVLSKKKGICFDYASLMAAMLRSQGVPTKLVVGYTGNVYHAWINVYSKEEGWIDGIISFDGKTWKLMDPTFASTGNSSDSVMQYIGDGKNYSAKYLY